MMQVQSGVQGSAPGEVVVGDGLPVGDVGVVGGPGAPDGPQQAPAAGLLGAQHVRVSGVPLSRVRPQDQALHQARRHQRLRTHTLTVVIIFTHTRLVFNYGPI